MIFINLLPDVKIEYIRALRIKRLLVLMSVILITCCLLISSIMYFITGYQQKAAISEIEGVPSNKADNIEATGNKKLIEEIQAKKGTDFILTLQDKLVILPKLHDNKTAVDRLFDNDKRNDLAYLNTLIDSDSVVESLSFDFVNNTFTLTGKTVDSASASVARDTIEFIGFEECRGGDEKNSNYNTRIYPFRVTTFNTANIAEGNEAQYKNSFTASGRFAPELFERSFDEDDLELIVPNAVTSTDEIPQPEAKCNPNPDENTQFNPVRAFKNVKQERVG